jgi:hypothetical protein
MKAMLMSVGCGIDGHGMVYAMYGWDVKTKLMAYDMDNGTHIDDIEPDSDWMNALSDDDRQAIARLATWWPCRCCGKPVRTFDGAPIHTACLPNHWDKHVWQRVQEGTNASRCQEWGRVQVPTNTRRAAIGGEK